MSITADQSRGAAEFVHTGLIVQCPRFGALTVTGITVDPDTNYTMIECTYATGTVRIEACLFCNGYLGGNFCDCECNVKLHTSKK